MHSQNAAERAIRTFKNHFIVGLCTCDPHFPLHLWDRLIPQAIIILNLLRSSKINPSLSAYYQLLGSFDFNRTPLAPPGTRVLIHNKPDERNSWSTHGEEGWYIGPAIEHYRCHKVYITKTRGERTGDTVTFFPTRVQMPKLSSADTIVKAATNLIEALHNLKPTSVFKQIGDKRLEALKQLADIFPEATSPRVENSNPQSTKLKLQNRHNQTPLNRSNYQ